MKRRSVLPADLAQVASQHYGVLARRAVGDRLSDHELASLVAHGVLERPHRGVYRLVGAERSFRHRAALAVAAFGPPVALSHLTAARLWGAPTAANWIDVTLPAQRSGRRAVATVHRADLPDGDLATRLGLPVTSAARTVVDLATGADALGDSMVLRLLDELAGGRHLTAAGLAAAIAAAHDRAPVRHRHLDTLFALHLEALGPASDSALEATYHRAVVAAGLPQPVRQHQVLVEGHVRLLDMAWPAALLALEVDGYRWHGSRRRFDEDRATDAALAELGWLVVRATSAMDPDDVAARLLRAHRQRLAGREAAALG